MMSDLTDMASKISARGHDTSAKKNFQNMTREQFMPWVLENLGEITEMLVARRIVTFVSEGASLSAGMRIGLIRFGSRVDVYLPEGARVLVSAGQTAIGGETVLAALKGGEAFRGPSAGIEPQA